MEHVFNVDLEDLGNTKRGLERRRVTPLFNRNNGLAGHADKLAEARLRNSIIDIPQFSNFVRERQRLGHLDYRPVEVDS